MEKYTPLLGLANNPSDHDAPDGQLSNVLNLIPEDDALKPITQGGISQGDTPLFTLDDTTCSIVYKHIGDGFLNYILLCGDGIYYRNDSMQEGEKQEIDQDIPQGVQLQAVNSIGKILVLYCADKTYYMYWKDYGYYSVGDFSCSVTVKSSPDGIRRTSGNDDYIQADLSDNPITVSGGNISDKESRELFNALVAKMNRFIDENDSKHIVRGTRLAVVAIRLYDESYIAVTDPFFLAPEKADNLTNMNLTVQNSGGLKIQKVIARLFGAFHDVRVTLNSQVDNEVLSNIVNGATLFMTLPIDTWEIDVPHSVQHDTNNDTYSMTFGRLSENDIYRKIEDVSFFRSIDFSLNDLHTGQDLQVENVLGSEEAISLADFRRTTMMAGLSYNYNNRVHVSGVSTDHGYVLSTNVRYILPKATGTQQLQGLFLGNYVDAQSVVQTDYVQLYKCRAKAIVTFDDDSTIYTEGYIGWPLPPIVSYPSRLAKKIDLYFILDGNYKKKTYTLNKSTNFGMSYSLNISANALREFIFNHTTESITQQEYEAITGSSLANDKKNNIIRWSEAENPFIFPVKNYVNVGVADVVGMATSTQPISEGQFGTAPLYVFTKDATWALSVNDTGGYDARQPATRDVISNKGSITPIDDSVLFITERGIMQIRGTTSVCISEALDGVPFYFYDAPRAADVYGGADYITYVDFKAEYLPEASMAYDYANQRLVVFNPRYDYAYVYSIKSGMWGAVENYYSSSFSSYPDNIAVIIDYQNEQLLAVKANTKTENKLSGNVNVFACTRPLQLDAPFSYKTIRTAILRGYFDRSHLATVLYGSNDLHHWFLVNDSADSYLRGRMGSPWKYFRLAFVGGIAGTESVSGIHADYFVRWNNQLR